MLYHISGSIIISDLTVPMEREKAYVYQHLYNKISLFNDKKNNEIDSESISSIQEKPVRDRSQVRCLTNLELRMLLQSCGIGVEGLSLFLSLTHYIYI